MVMSDEVFWLDDFKGEVESGYYVRCDLFKFFEMCEKNGKKIVGIVKPTDWNLQVICKKEDAKQKDGD